MKLDKCDLGRAGRVGLQRKGMLGLVEGGPGPCNGLAVGHHVAAPTATISWVIARLVVLNSEKAE